MTMLLCTPQAPVALCIPGLSFAWLYQALNWLDESQGSLFEGHLLLFEHGGQSSSVLACVTFSALACWPIYRALSIHQQEQAELVMNGGS